jgi:hypothetical protein
MDSNNMNNQNYQQNYQQPYQQQPVYNNFYQTPQIPEEYKPISMWGYLGYEILFALPFIGFILVIVMSFAPANKNVKNFARSFLLATIIGIVLVFIIFSLFGAAIVASLSQLG